MYNPVSERWSWEEKVPLIFDEEETRQGLHLPHFVCVTRLIAMAWRRKSADSVNTVHVQDGKPPEAKYIRWDEEEEDETQEDIAGETWRPLDGKIGIVPMDARYSISNFARLKSPSGEITAGHYYDERNWAAVKNCGLLDLTSAARRWRVLVVPKSIQTALENLECGVHPSHYAMDRGILEKSGWSSYSKAAVHLRPSALRRAASRIVDADLFDALMRMKDEGDARLGESLTDLMAVLNDQFVPGFSQRNLRWEMLRLARMSLVA
jgi:hypothetical protein